MTYAAALDLARERSYKSGNPGSAELFKLFLENPAAYRDYLQLRDRIRNGGAGEPALLDPNNGRAKAISGLKSELRGIIRFLSGDSGPR